MPKKPKTPERAGEQPTVPEDHAGGKLARLEALLLREGGATLTQMMEATGWQKHSVRGALSGGLKKKGLVITSEQPERVYRANRPQPETNP